MEDADGIVIEALLDDVLDKQLIADSVDEAIGIIQGPAATAMAVSTIDKELQRVEFERQRLMTAIASGRTVRGLLEALQALENRKTKLESERAASAPRRPVQRFDMARIRRELLELAGSWRQVLAEDRRTRGRL
jgi:hypothetical protein